MYFCMQVKKLETAIEILDAEKNDADFHVSSDDEKQDDPEHEAADVALPRDDAPADVEEEVAASSSSNSSSSKTSCPYCQESKEVAKGTRKRVRSKHKPNCERRKRAAGGGRKAQPR